MISAYKQHSWGTNTCNPAPDLAKTHFCWRALGKWYVCEWELLLRMALESESQQLQGELDRMKTLSTRLGLLMALTLLTVFCLSAFVLAQDNDEKVTPRFV